MLMFIARFQNICRHNITEMLLKVALNTMTKIFVCDWWYLKNYWICNALDQFKHNIFSGLLVDWKIMKATWKEFCFCFVVLFLFVCFLFVCLYLFFCGGVLFVVLVLFVCLFVCFVFMWGGWGGGVVLQHISFATFA